MKRTIGKALRVLGVVALISSPVALLACGTVRGAGEDLQYAADKSAEAMSGGETDAKGDSPN